MDNEEITRRDFLQRSGQLAVGIVAAEMLTGCHNEKPPSAPAHDVSPHTEMKSEVKFTDITTEANLDFIQYSGSCERHYFIDQVVAGACFIDANGDGFLDIFFPQPKPLGVCASKFKQPLRNRLYINDGKGRFTLKEDAFGGVETDFAIACAVGDYNNDGHADLYVCCYGRNTLWRNRGDGTFEDVTEKAGVGLKGVSTTAVWFDYDGDGFLDLFVGRYCEWNVDSDKDCGSNGKPGVCTPTYYLPAQNVLYHNNGDGTFTDVSHQAGIGLIPRRTLAVAAADFHHTGRLDLFVANDMMENFLYRNLGNGKFEDYASREGVALGSIKGDALANMGVAVGDYNEDGNLDVCVSTFSGEPYTLYKNEDGKFFSDVSMQAGIAEPTMPMLGFGTGFFDSRNIGRLDLFFANGHVNPFIASTNPVTTWKERNQLFLNDGAGKFTEDKTALPADDVRVHRGACFGDINNDGRIDILVTSTDDRPTLLRNDTPQQNWLLVQLTNKHGCCTPIGTKCIATIQGKTRMRVVLGSGSYAGDSDFRVHFGLGDATEVEKLEIQWLSGHKETHTKIAANQILKVKESDMSGS